MSPMISKMSFSSPLSQPHKIKCDCPVLTGEVTRLQKDLRKSCRESHLTPSPVPCPSLTPPHAPPRHLVDLVRDALVKSVHPSFRNRLFQNIINEVLRKKIFQTKWRL